MYSSSYKSNIPLPPNKTKEHPNGYHGHYNREYKQLVTLNDLNKLKNNNETIEIFSKYYKATKKLEHTLISNKDFVSVNEEEGILFYLFVNFFISTSKSENGIDSLFSGGFDFNCDVLILFPLSSVAHVIIIELTTGVNIKSHLLKSSL